MKRYDLVCVVAAAPLERAPVYIADPFIVSEGVQVVRGGRMKGAPLSLVKARALVVVTVCVCSARTLSPRTQKGRLTPPPPTNIMYSKYIK